MNLHTSGSSVKSRAAAKAFEEVAQKLKGIMNLGRINTDVNWYLTHSLGIRYTPIIISHFSSDGYNSIYETKILYASLTPIP